MMGKTYQDLYDTKQLCDIKIYLENVNVEKVP